MLTVLFFGLSLGLSAAMLKGLLDDRQKIAATVVPGAFVLRFAGHVAGAMGIQFHACIPDGDTLFIRFNPGMLCARPVR